MTAEQRAEAFRVVRAGCADLVTLTPIDQYRQTNIVFDRIAAALRELEMDGLKLA